MTSPPGTEAKDEGASRRRLRILFFLRGVHYGRAFENFLRAIVERGHELHVVFSVEKRLLGDDNWVLFDELRGAYDSFSHEQLEPRSEPWLVPAVALRHSLDYLRYFEPDYANAEPLRARACSRAPVLVRAALAFPFRGRVGRAALGGLLRRLEAAIPVPRELVEFVARHRPDVVLVSPLVGLGTIESEYVRAAKALGIPTVLPVASWDNLTNKGVLRDVPTVTIVWNQRQVDEAVRLHKVPAAQVVAVGAHGFDHWFGWRPSTTREQFATRMGIDAERPLILYLGSSYFITRDESDFIRDWLARVREHPRLHEAAVIFRPHPQNVVGWDTLAVEEPGKTVIWPRIGTAPTDSGKKREYFDTIFHSSAVVAVSTSALIEASIVGRPVLTIVGEYASTQEGTLHFAYLAHTGDGVGVVTVARSWEEHLGQIADAFAAPAAYEERIENFLRQFVRPYGIDVPAAPAAVDAVERAAATPIARPRRVSLLRPLFVLSTPALPIVLPLFRPRRLWRLMVKWVHRSLKGMQRPLKRGRHLKKELLRARKDRERARVRSEQAKLKSERQSERAKLKSERAKLKSERSRVAPLEAAAKKAKQASAASPKKKPALRE